MLDNTLLTKIDYKHYFDKAFTYQEYLHNFKKEIEMESQSKFAQYLPQNWQRQSRLDRKLKLNSELLNKVELIQSTVNWLVITEHWCGDASQINPVINKVAEASNKKIDLRFIYRDENPELIDAHLTDGRSRSIPIILALDKNFHFIKSYGPRPDEAQKLVKSILEEGGAYSIPLHTWYAKDKQKSLQEDLLGFINA